MIVSDGVNVQKLQGCRRPPIWPPTANESRPLKSPNEVALVPVVSLNSNCINCRLTFLTTGTLSKSFENFSTKPSGLTSGSKVTEVRAQVKANLPAVAENHLAATGLYVMKPRSSPIVFLSKLLVRVSLVVVGSPSVPDSRPI